MIALDKISDFDGVMQFYERALNFTKKLRFKINVDELKNDARKPSTEEMISLVRALTSSETLRIIQIEEMFEKSDKVNREIDKFFEGQSILKSIQVPFEDSEKYKIRHLRNCLVHSMYEIRVSDDGDDVYLYLNNQKIKGEIRLEDFLEVANKYTDWYNQFCQYQNVGILSYNAKLLNIPDKKKAINKFVRSISISNTGLSEKRMATLKKWIDRIGISNLKPSTAKGVDARTEEAAINTFIGDLVNCTAESEDDLKVYKPIKQNYDSVMFQFLSIQLPLYFDNRLLEDYSNDETYKEKQKDLYSDKMEQYNNMLEARSDKAALARSEKAQQEAVQYIANAGKDEYKLAVQNVLSMLAVKKPFVYSDMMMSLSYYVFNYISEINKGREDKIFDYYNIDTSGFDITYQERPGLHIRTVNLRRQCGRETESSKKKEIRKKIRRYGEEVEDSSNFFRHIRDSIAHGWSSVDYNKYFNTRNIDEIMFTFPTYSPENRELDFEAKISAKELLKLIENFRTRINEGINLSEDGKKIETDILRTALVDELVEETQIPTNLPKNDSQEKSKESSGKPHKATPSANHNVIPNGIGSVGPNLDDDR